MKRLQYNLSPDDSNGIRLHSEAQRIFERYVSGGSSRGPSPAGSEVMLLNHHI